MKIKIVALTLVMACLSGCATDRLLTQPTHKNIAQRLDRGDLIQIITKDQRFWEIKIVSHDKDSISGIRRGGETVTLPLEDIDEIRYKSLSAGKTFGASVLGYLSLIGLTVLIIFAGL